MASDRNRHREAPESVRARKARCEELQVRSPPRAMRCPGCATGLALRELAGGSPAALKGRVGAAIWRFWHRNGLYETALDMGCHEHTAPSPPSPELARHARPRDLSADIPTG